jgi:hypothetical protein
MLVGASPARIVCLVSLAVFVFAAAADAQNTWTLDAYPVQAPVVIDGQLDEDAWEEAGGATGFKQFEPDEGAPASQKTDVRVLYGERNLYVGVRLLDDAPSRIRQTLGRRDDYNQADWFTIALDSHFDQTTAYVFAVSAGGVQLDAIRTAEGGGPGPDIGDTSWDAIWESDVEVTSNGWIVEMRIPYSQLRFSPGSSRWGIHFTRRIPRLGEEAQWPLIPRAERENRVANFGLLTGLTDIEPRRNLEVRPYTVSKLQMQESSLQPGELATSRALDVGGDVKIGISSNVTLDATINPDFGQVESDPAVLNLTAFETFYDEKRPFFMEGVQIYEFGLGRRSDLLYTRRIGAEAPIVGATKISGRTPGGLSFGLLGATTGEAFNPTRHYGVARMSQQIGSYSSAGGIMTGFREPLPGGRYSSVAGGTDWDLRFLDNTYGLEGFATFTHRRWSMENRGTETGLAASLEAAKRRGNLTYDLETTVYDDTFDPNDLGRNRRNNYINVNGGLQREINDGQPFGPFQRANAFLYLDQNWSYRNQIDQGAGFFFRSRWTTRTFQSIGLGASADYLFGGFDLFETRGLGPRAQPVEVALEAGFDTDERRNWQIEPEVEMTFFGDGGRQYTVALEGDWDVGSRLSLRGNVEFEREDDRIAWASNETFRRADDTWQIGRRSASPDRLEAEDYLAFDDHGRLDAILDPELGETYYRPVFGARDTRSLDVTLRSNITFRPNLSLQLYSQLFAAKGTYRNFQLLKDPSTLEELAAYPKRDAFALSSFHLNTVLRWEYQPGSTLYLVWTQSRQAHDSMNPLAPWGSSPYGRPINQQIAGTFDIFPRNVFLVKLNYTFIR